MKKSDRNSLLTHSGMADCSIGTHLGEDCPQSSSAVHRIPSEREAYILKLRTGCANIQMICAVHFDRLFRRYTLNQKTCCDLLCRHSDKAIARGLRCVSVDLAEFKPGWALLPGEKLCTDCRKAVKEYEPAPSHSDADVGVEASSTSTDTDGSNGDPSIPPDPPVSQILTDINQTLAAIGDTPIDPTKLVQKTYPQRKAGKIQQTLCAQLGVEESRVTLI